MINLEELLEKHPSPELQLYIDSMRGLPNATADNLSESVTSNILSVGDLNGRFLTLLVEYLAQWCPQALIENNTPNNG